MYKRATEPRLVARQDSMNERKMSIPNLCRFRGSVKRNRAPQRSGLVKVHPLWCCMNRGYYSCPGAGVKEAAHTSIGVRLTQQWLIGAGPLNLNSDLLMINPARGASPVATTFFFTPSGCQRGQGRKPFDLEGRDKRLEATCGH
jgi:hypothetical protein